jgi:hypothetical protein
MTTSNHLPNQSPILSLRFKACKLYLDVIASKYLPAYKAAKKLIIFAFCILIFNIIVAYLPIRQRGNLYTLSAIRWVLED